MMVRLALRTLRYRSGGFVAALLTMFLGAAMVLACAGLMESGIRVAVPPQQLAGADIVVAGDQRYEVPGMGFGVVLPERVRIAAGLAPEIAALPGVDDVTAHIFDAPAPDGMIDALGVVAQPGTDIDDLRADVDLVLSTADGTAVTLIGDQRGLAELPQARLSADSLISLAGVFGAMALMVGAFGVASMLALSVQQRHREMALLRAIGSTPEQVRALVLGEVLILAAFATVAAIVPGRLLGEMLLDQLIGAGLVLDGVAFRLGWVPVVVAIAAVMAAAAGGAAVAGRRAAAVRPTQALADSRLPARRPVSVVRILIGLLLLMGGVALAWVTMRVLDGELASATGMPAVIVWGIGLAVLSPLLTRPLAALLDRPLRAVTGQPGRLAMVHVRATIDRAAAVVTPVIMLTGTAVGMLDMLAIEERAIEDENAARLVADVVVTAEAGVDEGLAAELGAVAGVAGAYEAVQSLGFVEAPHDPMLRGDGVGWTLQGLTPDAVGTLLPATITEGRVADLHGPAVAMGANQAAELALELGDTVTVRMGDNRARELELVALFTADGDPDMLLLPADVLAPHTTAGGVTQIFVIGDGGVDDDELIAGLQEVVASRDRLSVADRAAQLAGVDMVQGAQAFATITILVVIVTYSVISVVNALASSTVARRRELALQRLVGATRGHVLRMLATEGVAIAAIGILLGLAAAFAAIVPFGIGRAGSPYPAGSAFIYLGVVLGAGMLTVLATVLPGWHATRRRPIDALAG